jgi:hypothetical protein
MLGIVLAVLVSLPAPQDTATLDAPVYANEAYGVSVPRPFDDWVFEPGVGPQTATVIFHPRAAPLRNQLWGALILATFPSLVALRQVTDQRVAATWRRLLGRTYALLAGDSLAVDGLPAIRTLMSGAINHVALDVEEFTIARGSDLIILQLRYPRGLPRDSIAVGYRRVVGGLRIRGAPAPGPVTPPALADSVAAAGVVPESPWEAPAYDALVRYDAQQARADVAVRVDLVNTSATPADSVAIWLWPALALDSVRDVTANLALRTRGSVSWIRLPGVVQPQEATWFTVYYHAARGDGPLPARLLGITPAGAYFATDWLPRVQPVLDSAGQAVQETRARITLRFDLPEQWRAVAQGHLTSDVTSLGRRRMTWRTGDVIPAMAAFALGPYRVLTRREQGITVSVWLTPADSLPSPAIDALAASIQAAWSFCSRAFGRLPIGEINVTATDLSDVRGFDGLLLMGHPTAFTPPSPDSTPGHPWLPTFGVLAREVARTWWGNSAMAAGTGSAWILGSLPAWAAIAAQGVLQGDTVRQRLVREAEATWRAMPQGRDAPLSRIRVSETSAELLQSKGVAAVEAARRAAGEARFREALLLLAVDHRNSWVTLDDVLAALGPDAGAVLRPYLY